MRGGRRRSTMTTGIEPASRAKAEVMSTEPTKPGAGAIWPRVNSATASAGATIARVSGFASATAIGMLRPERRIIGTVMTLPPTPRNAAMPPTGKPSQLARPEEGRLSERNGGVANMGRKNPGRTQRSTMVSPIYATKPHRKNRSGAKRATPAPIAPPLARRTKSNERPLRRWRTSRRVAAVATRALTSMMSDEVAVAARTASPPSEMSTTVMTGTVTNPPPKPNRTVVTPTTRPMTMSRRMDMTSVHRTEPLAGNRMQDSSLRELATTISL